MQSDSGKDKHYRTAILFTLAAILILVAAAVVRSVNLQRFPMQVHNDESAMVIHGFRPMYQDPNSSILAGVSFAGHPNFGYWLSSLSSLLFGEETLWSLRIGSAIIGSLSLLFFGLFVINAFGRRTGLLFLLFASAFHIHFHFSRTGFHYIHAVFFTGLISWAFLMCVRSASLVWALVTGMFMGLGALVYPATHVLPAAMAVAWFFGKIDAPLLAPTVWHRFGRFAKLVGAFLLGLGATLGPQAVFAISHGFLGRLNATFLLHPHNIKHLSNELGTEFPTTGAVIWLNLHRTLRYFYRSDSGEQYHFSQNPLPTWGSALAIIGLLILLRRCLKRDPFALFVASVGLFTVLGSTLMIEANFSPHLILFSLLIPLAIAVGWDFALSLARARNVAVASILSALIALAWTDWNWKFYLDVVDPTKSRLTDTENWLLQLPIDTTKVTRLVNLSGRDINWAESYFELVYPAAEGIRDQSGDPAPKALRMVSTKTGPVVFVINRNEADVVQQELTKAGQRIQRFAFQGQRVDFLWVE